MLEDHEGFRQAVKRFAEVEIAPRAAVIDRENAFPVEVCRRPGASCVTSISLSPYHLLHHNQQIPPVLPSIFQSIH